MHRIHRHSIDLKRFRDAARDGVGSHSATYNGDTASYGPQHMNDGNSSTLSISAVSTSSWSKITLPEPMDIVGVDIDYMNSDHRVMLQYSNDDTNWTIAVGRLDHPLGTTGVDDPVFFPHTINARYWRMYTLLNTGIEVGSFKLYTPLNGYPGFLDTGKDLMRYGHATSSGQYSSYGPERMNDGDSATEGVINAGDPRWARFDLGSAFPISKIRVVDGQYSGTINVRYSNDATNWTTVTSVPKLADTTMTFSTVRARYWRLESSVTMNVTVFSAWAG